MSNSESIEPAIRQCFDDLKKLVEEYTPHVAICAMGTLTSALLRAHGRVEYAEFVQESFAELFERTIAEISKQTKH